MYSLTASHLLRIVCAVMVLQQVAKLTPKDKHIGVVTAKLAVKKQDGTPVISMLQHMAVKRKPQASL